LLPVVGALMLSIPMSVYSSRISLGRLMRRAGLFVIPEEANPPEELRRMQSHLLRAAPLPGFIEAVVDPLVHALACASGNMRRSQSPALLESRQVLINEAVSGGPEALSNAQKAALLGDPLALSRLHFQVWATPNAHPAWFRDMPAVVPLPEAAPPAETKHAEEAMAAAAG
jgi:membrane glycosyltransferase